MDSEGKMEDMSELERAERMKEWEEVSASFKRLPVEVQREICENVRVSINSFAFSCSGSGKTVDLIQPSLMQELEKTKNL